ncbi:mucin-2-like [Aplysia californica]|uniref:Mucin-2-like n=1 Tax=Aplysia californica TaxID=6500 RepID=A0ABM1W0J2_APLCA|nr:mucin-2-like [Aplysia californica]
MKPGYVSRLAIWVILCTLSVGRSATIARTNTQISVAAGEDPGPVLGEDAEPTAPAPATAMTTPAMSALNRTEEMFRAVTTPITSFPDLLTSTSSPQMFGPSLGTSGLSCPRLSEAGLCFSMSLQNIYGYLFAALQTGPGPSNFDLSELNNLDPAGPNSDLPPLDNFDPSAFNNPDPSAFNNIDPSALNNIDPALLSNIDPSLLNNIDPSLLNNIDPSLLNNIDPSLLNNIDPSLLNNIDPSALSNIDPSLLNNIDPSLLNNIDPSLLNNIDPSLLNNLDPSALNNIDPSLLNNLDPSVLNNFDPSAIDNIDPSLPNTAYQNSFSADQSAQVEEAVCAEFGVYKECVGNKLMGCSPIITLSYDMFYSALDFICSRGDSQPVLSVLPCLNKRSVLPKLQLCAANVPHSVPGYDLCGLPETYSQCVVSAVSGMCTPQDVQGLRLLLKATFSPYTDLFCDSSSSVSDTTTNFESTATTAVPTTTTTSTTTPESTATITPTTTTTTTTPVPTTTTGPTFPTTTTTSSTTTPEPTTRAILSSESTTTPSTITTTTPELTTTTTTPEPTTTTTTTTGVDTPVGVQEDRAKWFESLENSTRRPEFKNAQSGIRTKAIRSVLQHDTN